MNIKKIDEIIKLFCDIEENSIWGKDTELYCTDEKQSAIEKAREDVLMIINTI
jgi:hypothetical protein